VYTEEMQKYSRIVPNLINLAAMTGYPIRMFSAGLPLAKNVGDC
jgi:hypothetical protein